METAKKTTHSRRRKTPASTPSWGGARIGAIVEAFDKLSPEYGSPADGGRPDLQAKARIAAIEMMGAEHQSSILDAGCGNGALMLELIRKGHRGILVGADFSNGMLEVLTERTGAVASRGQVVHEGLYLCRTLVQELPFAASTFDAVICVNTLHNLPSEEAVMTALKEFMRVCRSSGRLILQIHNANNPLVRRHFALYSRSHMPLRSYTAKWLRSVLESGGFRITKQVPLGFPVSAIAPFLVVKAEKLK